MRCKLGQMAIVRKGRNAGRIVCIKVYMGPMVFADAGPMPHMWGITSDRPLSWASMSLSRGTLNLMAQHNIDGWFDDSNLTPINDPDTDVSETETETKERETT